MAQEKVLGDQLNILDVASDISNDSTAIGDIAAGIVNDPAAQAAITAGIDHAGLIGVSGSPATYTHTEIDAHIDDSSIHFTEASIVHQNISDPGINDHAAIDAHIADTSIHFTQLSDLADVQYSGSPLTAQVLTWNTGGYWEPTTPIDTAAIWGNITGTLSDQTDLQAALDLKADVGIFNSHVGDLTIHFTETSIVHQNISGAGTNTHLLIDNHIANNTIHFTVPTIDHTQMLPISIGTNSHPAIDVHIANTAIHFTTLSGLSDVDTTGAISGMYLAYNGATWIPQSPPPQSPLIGDLDTAGFSIVTLDTIDDVSANNIVIKAGDNNKGTGGTNTTFTGGNVDIIAGSAYANYNMPGHINIRGGNSDQYGMYGSPYLRATGDVNISGGEGIAYGYGGVVNISGGVAASGDGGNVNISGGIGNYNDGDIAITTGGYFNIASGSSVTVRMGQTSGTFAVFNGDGTTKSASIQLKGITAFTTIKAPDNQIGNHNFTLPPDYPLNLNKSYLTCSNSGIMSWSIPPTTLFDDTFPRLSTNLNTLGSAIVSGGGEKLYLAAQLSLPSDDYIPKGFGGTLTGSPPTGDQDNGLDLLSGLSKNSINLVTASNANIRAHTTALKIYGGGNSNTSTSKGILELYTAGTGPKYLFSNSITLSANVATVGKIDFVFPVDGGTPGEVLITDGTGEMSWGSSFTSVGINNQSIPGVGSPLVYTYTLQVSDIGTFIVVNQAAANTVAIPPGASFPIGARFEITQLGVSDTTITVSGGEVIRYKDTTLGAQTGTSVIVKPHQEAKMTKINATTWFASLSGVSG